jgi:hypothetical protein
VRTISCYPSAALTTRARGIGFPTNRGARLSSLKADSKSVVGWVVPFNARVNGADFDTSQGGLDISEVETLDIGLPKLFTEDAGLVGWRDGFLDEFRKVRNLHWRCECSTGLFPHATLLIRVDSEKWRAYPSPPTDVTISVPLGASTPAHSLPLLT